MSHSVMFLKLAVSYLQQVNGGAYSRKSKGSVSKGSAVVHISVDDSETEAVKERLDAPLLYKISDTPPISVIIFLGFQVSSHLCVHIYVF